MSLRVAVQENEEVRLQMLEILALGGNDELITEGTGVNDSMNSYSTALLDPTSESVDVVNDLNNVIEEDEDEDNGSTFEEESVFSVSSGEDEDYPDYSYFTDNYSAVMTADAYPSNYDGAEYGYNGYDIESDDKRLTPSQTLLDAAEAEDLMVNLNQTKTVIL